MRGKDRAIYDCKLKWTRKARFSLETLLFAKNARILTVSLRMLMFWSEISAQ